MVPSRRWSCWLLAVSLGLGVWAVQPAASDEPKSPSPAPELKITRLLSQTIDVKFEKLPLEQCIKELAEKAGVSIRWDGKVDPKYKAAEVTIEASGLRAGTILGDMLEQNDLAVRFEGEAVTIVRLGRFDALIALLSGQNDEFLPRPSEAELKILKALDEPTTAEFVETPLEDTLSFIRDKGKINVVSDATVLTAEKRKTPVNLSLANARLRSVLQALLRDQGLTYIVEDDALRITSPAVASEQFLIRTYPVADLCAAAEDLKSLVQTIERTVDLSTWERQGGKGNISPATASHSLVINQTWQGHQRVLDLLRMLRQAKAQ